MRILIALLIFLTFSYATTVYGNIIEAENFEQVNNTIVKLIGPTTTQFVVNENYSIELAPGNYTLTAHYLENGKLKYYTKDNFTVTGEKQLFDIILLPTDFQESYDLELDMLDPPIKNKVDTTAMLTVFALVIVGLLLILTLVWYYIIRKKDLGVRDDIEKVDKKYSLDQDGKKVLEIIEQNEGRLTQKELRQILKWSEAKTSLVVAELEAIYRIKRIRKGRENILKLIKE